MPPLPPRLLRSARALKATTQAGLAYAVGIRAKAISAANPANFMHGLVTSYSGTTLVINVDATGGSGTLADWNLAVQGETGATGATGATGPAGSVDTVGGANITTNSIARGANNNKTIKETTGATCDDSGNCTFTTVSTTGDGSAGATLRIWDQAGDNYTGFKSADTLTSNRRFDYPDTTPTTGQLMAIGTTSGTNPIVVPVTYVTPTSKIWLPVAGGTAAVPMLLWDTLATNAPTASCAVGGTETTRLRCHGVWPDSDGDYSIQQVIQLPDDIVVSAGIDLKFIYKTVTANTGLNTVWQAATACAADGETEDTTYNAASASAADAGKGTTLQLNTVTITGVTITGTSACAAGELMSLKIFRNRTHASDTMTGEVRLIGVEVTTRRAF